MRCLAAILAVAMLTIAGCAKTQAKISRDVGETAPAVSQVRPPILYQRTGGIAGTDDRVVIWPDGTVEVTGRIMSPAYAKLPEDRFAMLATALKDWPKLDNEYPASAADAYTITITFGDKSITASDLAPNLPHPFRIAFAEIEAIAAQAADDGKVSPEL